MLGEATPHVKASLTGRVRRRLFGLSLEEASFAKRGFRYGAHQASRRLERVGRTFLQGYHAALEETDHAALTSKLDETAVEFRGFAYEGAAMGMALLVGPELFPAYRYVLFLLLAIVIPIFFDGKLAGFAGAGQGIRRARHCARSEVRARLAQRVLPLRRGDGSASGHSVALPVSADHAARCRRVLQRHRRQSAACAVRTPRY
jgi:hypothetical protein